MSYIPSTLFKKCPKPGVGENFHYLPVVNNYRVAVRWASSLVLA